MTVSRISATALLALLCLALPLGAAAQVDSGQGNGGPIRLTPPGINDAAPEDLSPAEATPENNGSSGGSFGGQTFVAPGPGVSPSAPRRGIQIQPLSRPSIETLGVLHSGGGSLGYDLWERSQRGIVLGLMRRVPGALDSMTGRQIAYRLLLTDAAPPLSGTEHENADLLAERIERLRAFGHSRGLLRLLDVIPGDIVARRFSLEQVEAQLLEGDYAGACANARAQADLSSAPFFWQKTLIVCQIHNGEIAAAQLGLQLMAELPGPESGAFLAMGRRMLDGFGEVPQAISASAPDLAMADLLGESLPADFLPLEAPGFAKAALRLAGLPPETRARAAEQAVMQALVPPSALERAYREIAFTPEQRDAALTLAGSQPASVGRALLYQAGARSNDPAAHAEILLNAFETAHDDHLYQAVVAAFEGQLTRLPATPQTAWFAASAGRALYALGRYEQAAQWLELARSEAMVSPQAQASVTLLWPYTLLAGDSAADWDGSLSAWALARNEAPATVERLRDHLTTSFRAFGANERLLAGVAQSTPAASGPVTPDPTNLLAMRDAADDGRRGEVLLLVLAALGAEGSDSISPMVQDAVLQSMLRVGMADEARRLAIEMALRAGI